MNDFTQGSWSDTKWQLCLLSTLLIQHCMSIVWIYYILFIHSSINVNLTCSHVLPIMIICPRLGWPVFISLGFIASSGIVGSYGKSMFNPLRNWETVSQSSCIFSHSHQQCMRVPISPYPHHILVSVNWNLTVVLICTCLKAYDIEHLFICLLTMCVVFEKMSL